MDSLQALGQWFEWLLHDAGMTRVHSLLKATEKKEFREDIIGTVLEGLYKVIGEWGCEGVVKEDEV
jgi:hypothetical protein